MRHWAAWMLAALAAGAAAGPAPLALRFVPLDGATGLAGDVAVDLGAMSAPAGAARRKGAVTLRRVGLRLESADRAPTSARVSVALDTESPGSQVRVDGIVLSTVPRLVDPAHRVGTTVPHRIEVTISPEMQPGPFASRLIWTADTE